MITHFSAFKDKLEIVERQKDWKKVIQMLRSEWEKNHSSYIAGLCIDECFWLNNWADESLVPELKQFQEELRLFLDEVVGYGLKHLRKAPYFLWRLGAWMAGGCGHGYLLLDGKTSGINIQNFDAICMDILDTAYCEWSSPLVLSTLEAAKGNWNWTYYANETLREMARQELDTLHSRNNIVDIEMRSYYGWVYKNTQNAVDQK